MNINIKKGLKIIALGDSLTRGFPFGMRASWVNILNTEKGFNITNKGINGDTLEGMLERFQRDVVDLEPDMVIIMGGTNDAFGEYSLSSMKSNLRQVVKKAISLGIKPVIGIPIPVDEPTVEIKLKRFRDFLKNLCHEHNIAFIDFYEIMVNEHGRIKEELDFDGVHPNKDGYRVMAARAYDVLTKV